MNNPDTGLEAFRRLGLEWHEGEREIIVRQQEGEIITEIPPDEVMSLTPQNVLRLVRKGWLTDGDLVTVWEIEQIDSDGTKYFRNASSLPLSEVRARIRQGRVSNSAKS